MLLNDLTTGYYRCLDSSWFDSTLSTAWITWSWITGSPGPVIHVQTHVEQGKTLVPECKRMYVGPSGRVKHRSTSARLFGARL